MVLMLELDNPVATDTRVLAQELIESMQEVCFLIVDENIDEWKAYKSLSAFTVQIAYGDSRHTITFNVQLNELELFATAILKKIKMFRRDYSSTIKEKMDNDAEI